MANQKKEPIMKQTHHKIFERLESNFEPTQKRREPTFFLEDEDDDLTDLEPTARSFIRPVTLLPGTRRRKRIWQT
jgi:hypothetical protein